MKTSIISIDKNGKRTTLCTFSTKKEALLALNKINDLEKSKKECAEELQKRDIKLEEYTYELEKAKYEDLTWHERLITHDIGVNAYASNPAWYKGGDNKNGESELAGKEFFDTDKDFRPAEFMHFCSQMLVKEPKNGVTDEEIEQEEQNEDGKKTRQKSKAPCMIIFCAFEQLHYLIDLGKRYGF